MIAGRFVRYLIVGGTCAALQNAAIVCAVWGGAPYLLANLLTALAFVPAGYALHSVVTFGTSPTLSGLARFVGGVLAGIPVSSALLWLTHRVAALPIEIASPLSTVAMAFYGFVVTGWLATRRERAPARAGRTGGG